VAKLLVTGGAGYVGSALLPHLLARGHGVTVLDDFRGGSPRNLVGAAAADYEFVRGDVCDPDAVRRAVAGVDAVIHLAAITGAGSSHERREEVFAVNRDGTETLLEAAADAGVDRVVLASSCNVYGGTDDRDLTETSDPEPANPYASSKLAAERRCLESPVEAVCLRMATNFGWSPGVRFNLVVNAFGFRALAGEPLTVYGDGSNWRPYVHVTDAARAFASALEWDPGVYNVGVANHRLDDVAAAVAEAVDRPVEVDHLHDRDPGPSYHVRFDRMDGQSFTPDVSLAAGVADLVARFGDGPAPEAADLERPATDPAGDIERTDRTPGVRDRDASEGR
jgi:nucleoside-diphosphate-sugar epimerase